MSCRQGIKRCCRAETGWLWKAHSGSVQKVEVWCSKEDKQRNWFLKQRPGACLGHASRGAYLTGIPRHKQTVTTSMYSRPPRVPQIYIWVPL